EGRLRVGLHLAADEDRDGEGLTDDVLALGEHRPLEARDIVHADAEQFCGLCRREPGADVRLDLAWADRRARSLVIAAPAGATDLALQHIIDGESESLAGTGGEDQQVVFGADDSDVFHANAPL